MFTSKFYLKFRDEKIEVDFQKMKETKFLIFNKWIVLFSFISAVAVAILQSTNFEKIDEYVFFKFNIIMNFIAIFVYFIFLFFAFFSTNLTILRWVHYFIFYFQIFVIMAFRFEIFKILISMSTLNFFQYLIEMFVRLVWVILFLHSFLERSCLNSTFLFLLFLFLLQKCQFLLFIFLLFLFLLFFYYIFYSKFKTKPKLHKLVAELKLKFRLSSREISLTKMKNKNNVEQVEEVIMSEFVEEYEKCNTNKSLEVCIKYLNRFVENDLDKKNIKLFK
jgi:hypothetical protein